MISATLFAFIVICLDLILSSFISSTDSICSREVLLMPTLPENQRLMTVSFLPIIDANLRWDIPLFMSSCLMFEMFVCFISFIEV